MKSKLRRKIDGPGWFEVIFGAALSLLLGVVLSAAFLIFKPVTTVKELPKEPDKKMIYYIEGTRDSSKARDLASKRKLMTQSGATVVLNEDELNTLAIPPKPEAGPKKMELPQPVAATETLVAKPANFRIREGVMQIGVPVTLSAYEMSTQLVLQTRGGFVKQGDALIYQPTEFYLGSLPLQRMPEVQAAVTNYLFSKMTVPDDMVAAWKNVADASLAGPKLTVTVR
ncbi:MAG: hypothetical protein ABIV50_11040 [Opitutus sp.]